jgi:hypothetical protein
MDKTFDTHDGADLILPVRVVEFVGCLEDRDSAVFVTIAALVVGFAGTEWFCLRGDLGDALKQVRLVALDLDDQRDISLLGNLEMFF